MRTISFIIFFSIALTIYGLLNYYIYIRGLQSIPQGSTYRTYYIFIFWAVALTFIAGRLLEPMALSVFSDILIWIGSLWLAAMLYFFLIVLFLDIIRLLNHWLPVVPDFISDDYIRAKQVVAFSAVGLVAIVMIIGHINALHPRMTTLNVAIPKKAGAPRELNIVAASDIHLGTIVNRSRLEGLVQKINDLKPDIVFLPGDIVDEDLAPVIRENTGEALKKINAPLGVFAVTGNHEYIGGAEKACSYLENHNVTMLRDGATKIDNSFYLVGREDRECRRFNGKNRKSLNELMVLADKDYPVILLDHQPFDLNEAVANGIDLQISGHTHHGQLWPLNYITEMVYEISRGYRRKGDTQFLVSSGFGTWGPPIRTNSRPEIVNIRLSLR